MAEEAISNNEVSVQNQWEQICNQLKLEFGETAFDSWFLQKIYIELFLKSTFFLFGVVQKISFML